MAFNFWSIRIKLLNKVLFLYSGHDAESGRVAQPLNREVNVIDVWSLWEFGSQVEYISGTLKLLMKTKPLLGYQILSCNIFPQTFFYCFFFTNSIICDQFILYHKFKLKLLNDSAFQTPLKRKMHIDTASFFVVVFRKVESISLKNFSWADLFLLPWIHVNFRS